MTPQVGRNSWRCSEVYEWTEIFRGEQMAISGTCSEWSQALADGKVKQQINQHGQNKQRISSCEMSMNHKKKKQKAQTNTFYSSRISKPVGSSDTV